jgi:hypothetical protein
MRKKVKTKACVVLAVSLCVLSGGFAYSVLNPWSRINCTYEDIDIRTGRVRFQRHILFLKVTDRIKKTSISKMWEGHFGDYPDPVWRRVNTFWGFDAGGHSPHHAYHGAIGAGRVLEKGIALALYSEEAQEKAIHTFFELLQAEESDLLASRYAHFLSERAEDGLVIDQNDVPLPDE